MYAIGCVGFYTKFEYSIYQGLNFISKTIHFNNDFATRALLTLQPGQYYIKVKPTWGSGYV